MYRTVLKEGAKKGPNFAGRYTIVTWGAGLGDFSLAVIDAKTGRVYFPPFREVGNSSYGLPLVDKGNNPAWRPDSKLFAFVGLPGGRSSKGTGLYVYEFNHGLFRLIQFIPERSANHPQQGHAG